MKNKTKVLQELQDHIEDSYAGDYASVSRDLTKAIYCLHFLEKEEIPPHEVQDLCFALHQLSECFHWAHGEKRLQIHAQLNPR